MKFTGAMAGMAVALLAACATSKTRNAVDVPIPPPTAPVPLLLEALSSTDSRARSSAAWQLAGAKQQVPEAISALEPLLTDADRSVRYAATWALRYLQPPDKDAPAKPGETPPKPLNLTRPVYPQAAFEAKIEGMVEIELLIGEEGEVAHLEVRQSIPELDEAALACVRQWQFEPKRVDGVPRATVARAPVKFRIY